MRIHFPFVLCYNNFCFEDDSVDVESHVFYRKQKFVIIFLISVVAPFFLRLIFFLFEYQI